MTKGKRNHSHFKSNSEIKLSFLKEQRLNASCELGTYVALHMTHDKNIIDNQIDIVYDAFYVYKSVMNKLRFGLITSFDTVKSLYTVKTKSICYFRLTLIIPLFIQIVYTNGCTEQMTRAECSQCIYGTCQSLFKSPDRNPCLYHALKLRQEGAIDVFCSLKVATTPFKSSSGRPLKSIDKYK